MLTLEQYFAQTDKLDNRNLAIDGLDKRYWMNSLGLVWDSKLKRNKFPYWYKGIYYYGFEVNQKKVNIPWKKLYLMAYSDMDTTLETYLNVLKIEDRDPNEVFPVHSKLLWIIPEGGVESKSRSGFYTVPGVPFLQIRKTDYSFYNRKSCKFVNVLKDAKNDLPWYPTISVDHNRIFNPQFSSLVHRLVALAFIPILPGRKNFYVNHIDGNKENYHVENLEWTNHLKNNLHAIEHGLRTDTRGVRMTNMKTGEVENFPSAGYCAKYFDTVTGNITYAMVQWDKKKFVKYSPWVIQWSDAPRVTPDAGVLNNISPGSSLFYLLEKGDSHEYYFRMTSIPPETGITRKVLSKYSKRLVKEPIKGYLVSTFTEHEVPESERSKVDFSKNKIGKMPVPVLITDLNTNEKYQYPSTEAFAKELGVLKKSIQHVANLQNGRWKHYHIQYLR